MQKHNTLMADYPALANEWIERSGPLDSTASNNKRFPHCIWIQPFIIF